MLLVIEAMHPPPASLQLQPIYSSSQDRPLEQQHSSSQLLFGYSDKPAASPPAAGFFIFFADDLMPFSQIRAADDFDFRWSVPYSNHLQPARLPNVLTSYHSSY
jgi:hypothetical protein